MDFSTLYTQLVLRDLIGYIGPRLIVCVTVAVILLGGSKELLLYLKEIPGLAAKILAAWRGPHLM
jgi:hypothetical protein